MSQAANWTELGYCRHAHLSFEHLQRKQWLAPAKVIQFKRILIALKITEVGPLRLPHHDYTRHYSLKRFFMSTEAGSIVFFYDFRYYCAISRGLMLIEDCQCAPQLLTEVRAERLACVHLFVLCGGKSFSLWDQSTSSTLRTWMSKNVCCPSNVCCPLHRNGTKKLFWT